MAYNILCMPGNFVCYTLVVQFSIVSKVARYLLDLAFEYFALALEFITIHSSLFSDA